MRNVGMAYYLQADSHPVEKVEYCEYRERGSSRLNAVNDELHCTAYHSVSVSMGREMVDQLG